MALVLINWVAKSVMLTLRKRLVVVFHGRLICGGIFDLGNRFWFENLAIPNLENLFSSLPIELQLLFRKPLPCPLLPILLGLIPAEEIMLSLPLQFGQVGIGDIFQFLVLCDDKILDLEAPM